MRSRFWSFSILSSEWPTNMPWSDKWPSQKLLFFRKEFKLHSALLSPLERMVFLSSKTRTSKWQTPVGHTVALLTYTQVLAGTLRLCISQQWNKMHLASDIPRKWSRRCCQTGQVLLHPGCTGGSRGGLNQECTEHNLLIQICKKIAMLYTCEEGGGWFVRARANL